MSRTDELGDLLPDLKNSKKVTSEDIKDLTQDGPTDFYCIAREDGLVPCETQCITCLKKNSEK